MAIVTYSEARQNLARLMDEVERDRTSITITRRRRKGAAVLVSEEEWSAIQETLYLLSSRKNARLLRKAVADLDAGRGIEFDPAREAKRGKRR